MGHPTDLYKQLLAKLEADDKAVARSVAERIGGNVVEAFGLQGIIDAELARVRGEHARELAAVRDAARLNPSPVPVPPVGAFPVPIHYVSRVTDRDLGGDIRQVQLSSSAPNAPVVIFNVTGRDQNGAIQTFNLSSKGGA